MRLFSLAIQKLVYKFVQSTYRVTYLVTQHSSLHHLHQMMNISKKTGSVVTDLLPILDLHYERIQIDSQVIPTLLHVSLHFHNTFISKLMFVYTVLLV